MSNVVGTVSPTEVSNLPILDRNFSGLETLIPGVRQAEGFDPTKTRVGNISVNGGDGRQVDTSVDGGDNKDLVVGGLVQNFTMEGIQEFNVSTNRYTAEAGHSVAAVVNVVTKSGTNTIHGSAFALFQNSALDKNDYFTLQTCTGEGITSGNCPKPLLHIVSLRRIDWRSHHQGQAVLLRRFRAEARAGQHHRQSYLVRRSAGICCPDRRLRRWSVCRSR